MGVTKLAVRRRARRYFVDAVALLVKREQDGRIEATEEQLHALELDLPLGVEVRYLTQQSGEHHNRRHDVANLRRVTVM